MLPDPGVAPSLDTVEQERLPPARGHTVQSCPQQRVFLARGDGTVRERGLIGDVQYIFERNRKPAPSIPPRRVDGEIGDDRSKKVARAFEPPEVMPSVPAGREEANDRILNQIGSRVTVAQPSEGQRIQFAVVTAQQLVQRLIGIGPKRTIFGLRARCGHDGALPTIKIGDEAQIAGLHSTSIT